MVAKATSEKKAPTLFIQERERWEEDMIVK